MTRVISPPTLNDNILTGHSPECGDLRVREYPDLFASMQAVAAQSLAMLEGDIVMEKDMRLALMAKELTRLGGHNCNKEVLERLKSLMEMLRISGLSESEKAAIWQPIAKCYASVVNALAERIPPLEGRELVAMGSVITLPVTFVRILTNRGFTASVELPKFKFAAKYDRVEGRYPLQGASFLDSYLDKLPIESLRAKFATVPQKYGALNSAEFTINLPLQIVRPLMNGIDAIVEIPDGALEAALRA